MLMHEKTCVIPIFVTKIFVLSIFEWLLKTGFTVYHMLYFYNFATTMIKFVELQKHLASSLLNICNIARQTIFMYDMYISSIKQDSENKLSFTAQDIF